MVNDKQTRWALLSKCFLYLQRKKKNRLGILQYSFLCSDYKYPKFDPESLQNIAVWSHSKIKRSSLLSCNAGELVFGLQARPLSIPR